MLEMMSKEKLETRAIIKLFKDLGKHLKNAAKSRGKTSVSHALVFKWHKCFSEGRESIQDDTR
jgi:hypothetical protein